MSIEQQLGEVIGEMRGVIGDLNTIVDTQKAQGIEIASVKTEQAVQRFRINLFSAIGVFFAGIIVPSIWAVIFASIVNKDVISGLLSFLP